MSKKPRTHAYIDGNNLHKGIQEMGWKLDYKRFRVFLKEKYGVDEAFYFIGLIPANKELYNSLQRWGYELVFKETLPNGEGEVKGNCDAELVLHAVSEFYQGQYEKAVLVSSDGDFACLVSFLNGQGAFDRVISPNKNRTSLLLKRTGVKITFLDSNRMKKKLGRPYK